MRIAVYQAGRGILSTRDFKAQAELSKAVFCWQLTRLSTLLNSELMITSTRAHLVGIGGIGMSGLARLLAAAGIPVAGSDAHASKITERLAAEGFEVAIGQSAANLARETDLVIHSPAVPADNPELVEARARNLKILSYPQAVAELVGEPSFRIEDLDEFADPQVGKRLIAVAGTHGKTTTTGLIAAGLIHAGEEPSVLVGSNLPLLGGTNARAAAGDWFVLEACEHQRSFLAYRPEILVITSLEADHLDYYRDWDDYLSAFVELAGQMPRHGMVIAHRDLPGIEKIAAVAPSMFYSDGLTAELPELAIPGEHNRANARLALLACDLAGAEIEAAAEGIARFAGSERRLERRGSVAGAEIFDDYAHHPTEIRATLQALRESQPGKKIIACYQQHQAGRARTFFAELAASFGQADRVIIPNIYVTRESAADAEQLGRDLAAAISAAGTPADFAGSLAAAEGMIRELADADSVILIAGAGDVAQLADSLAAG